MYIRQSSGRQDIYDSLPARASEAQLDAFLNSGRDIRKRAAPPKAQTPSPPPPPKLSVAPRSPGHDKKTKSRLSVKPEGGALKPVAKPKMPKHNFVVGSKWSLQGKSITIQKIWNHKGTPVVTWNYDGQKAKTNKISDVIKHFKPFKPKPKPEGGVLKKQPKPEEVKLEESKQPKPEEVKRQPDQPVGRIEEVKSVPPPDRGPGPPLK